MIDLRGLYAPLSTLEGSNFLINSELPFLLSNTCFEFPTGDTSVAKKAFLDHQIPESFTVPLAKIPLGYFVVETFSLCGSAESVRSKWTEHVSWSESGLIAKIVCRAFGIGGWEIPLSRTFANLLQSTSASAFVAYLYGEPSGAIIVNNGVGILGAVLPHRGSAGVGEALLGRIYPAPFIRVSTQANEFPGPVLEEWVRLEDRSPR